MADIKLTVDPAVMNAKAGDIEARKAAVQQLLAESEQTVKSLEADWESESSRTFQSKFAQIRDDVENVFKIITEYVNDLREMANIYAQAEGATQEAAGSLPTQGVFSA
jgi:WXG100 family type VII secretion target